MEKNAPKPEDIQAERIVRGHDTSHVWQQCGEGYMSVHVPRNLVPNVMAIFEHYRNQHPHNNNGKFAPGSSSDNETNIIVDENTLGGVRAHLAHGKLL